MIISKYIKYFSCPRLVNAKLQPEQLISIELANNMRALTLSGEYKGVWFSVPNESKRSRLLGAIMVAMGLLSGVSDFIFIHSNGVLFCELKAGKNTQSDNQELFQQWVECRGFEYIVAYSADEVIEKLKEKNLL